MQSPMIHSETNFAVMTTMEDKRQSKNKHSAFVRQEHLNSSVDHQLQDDDENDSEDSENASSTVNQLNPMTNENDELEEKHNIGSLLDTCGFDQKTLSIYLT